MNKKIFLGGTSLSCLLWAGSAAAQTTTPPKEQADGGELNIVVVTANRRLQNIQDVGLVVNQFSGETLRELGALDTKDLAQLVPGVYVAGAYGGQSQQFTIRGVVQSDYLDTIENPVAFYIDDVYITSAQGQTMSFFDIGRVEVLKGPQGTLFGRNATGGLIHTVVEKPRLGAVEGYADLSYARFNEVNGQGRSTCLSASTRRYAPQFCTRGSTTIGRTSIPGVHPEALRFCRSTGLAETPSARW